MNEATNIFMTMIESTLNKMIDNRIEAKRDETLQTLWNDLSAANERISRLETDLKAVEGQLYDLKNATPTVSQPALGVAVLDQTEEFRHAVIKIINTHTMGDEFLNPLIDALLDCDTFSDKVKEIASDQVGSSIEDAMSDHCCDYEHDDIHESSDIDSDAVKDIIKEVLNNTTVTLKI